MPAVCMCVYVCMYVCMYACTYACIHFCIYVFMYYAYEYVCMYVWMLYVCMYACRLLSSGTHFSADRHNSADHQLGSNNAEYFSASQRLMPYIPKQAYS
jgi:hypothetical protein